MPMPDLVTDLSPLSLADIARMAADQRLPPVASWNPEQTGHSRMRIARDGTWFHDGAPIRRETMVRLFSTILRREADDSHVLVTPAEKLVIDVDDAPFIAVEVKSDGTGNARQLAFRLNTGDLVLASAHHLVRIAGSENNPRPYLGVRGGMEARINRAVYYELATMAIDEGADPPGLWSSGMFFALSPTP